MRASRWTVILVSPTGATVVVAIYGKRADYRTAVAALTAAGYVLRDANGART